jgi:DNA polymerase-1
VLEDPQYSNVHIRMVSKDKDLEQLLCDRVSLFDVHTDITRDVAGLLTDKGITPAQVVDVMALTGDTVDNVPGVEGIGPKTAAQLVRQYGDMETLLQSLDQIKGKRRECLEKARDFLPVSKAMVTLKRDADLPFSMDAARAKPINTERLIPLFQTLGFHRYQEKAQQLAAQNVPSTPESSGK